MKKAWLTLGILAVIVILTLGYFETNYCHFWTTQAPIGSSADYIKTTGLCKINAYLGIPGALIIGLVGAIMS